MYKRKTKDVYSIEGYYYGEWSLECNAENLRDAKRLYREYSENCPGTSFRIKKSRERIKEEK